MKAAANYAFANRQALAYHARRSFQEVFGTQAGAEPLRQVYDIAHNREHPTYASEQLYSLPKKRFFLGFFRT